MGRVQFVDPPIILVGVRVLSPFIVTHEFRKFDKFTIRNVRMLVILTYYTNTIIIGTVSIKISSRYMDYEAKNVF